MNFFVFFAYAAIGLGGVLIALSLGLIAHNYLSVRANIRTQDARLALRGTLINYISGRIKRRVAIQMLCDSDTSLLPGLVAQLIPTINETSSALLLDLLQAPELKKPVSKFNDQTQSNNWRERQTAVTWLPLINFPEYAIPKLIDALFDENIDVRLAAAQGLAHLKHGLSAPMIIVQIALPGAWTLFRLIEIFEKMGPTATPYLMEILNSDEITEAQAISSTAALGLLKAHQAIPKICSNLDNSCQELRIQSIKALGLIGDTSTSVELRRLLSDPDSTIRSVSANALGLMKTFEAIPALKKCLHDSSWWVRINASKALEGMGERGIAALRGSLESSDRFEHELSREVLLRNESTHNKVIGQA